MSSILFSENLLRILGPYTPSTDELQLSNQLTDYWARFATFGDPNSPKEPRWRRYARSDHILQLDEQPTRITGYHNPQCDFLSTLLTP
jgi:carboxylesterase type B